MHRTDVPGKTCTSTVSRSSVGVRDGVRGAVPLGGLDRRQQHSQTYGRDVVSVPPLPPPQVNLALLNAIVVLITMTGLPRHFSACWFNRSMVYGVSAYGISAESAYRRNRPIRLVGLVGLIGLFGISAY